MQSFVVSNQLIIFWNTGLIAYMDEECLRPGDPTDATLLEKMNKNLFSHKHYLSHERADIQTQKVMGRDVSRIF